jgi:coenzyme F420 hydrogenase subunit beta
MKSIAEVVANGMCIGCGLCESVTEGRVHMALTEAGGHRPTGTDFSDIEEATLLASCPGNTVSAREEHGTPVDAIWGANRSMSMAWSGEPEVRHQAATGGVLTALARHLVDTGEVAFVLHARADPAAPMRSVWTMSETVDEVLEASGSRYGPVSVLAGMHSALDRGEPFAVVGKPCDVSAVHGLAQADQRVDKLCVARLTMVCGGTSRLTKSRALLDEIGYSENEVTLFRYRGNGNPGPTRVEATGGRIHERNYLEMWADEAGWDLETRCKFCPDALGEASDVSAADAWPGGAPAGEDEGFNAIVVRTAEGERLVNAAVASGHLVVGEPVSPEQLNDFQPHQVRKKHAVAARLCGVQDAGLPTFDTTNLRVDELGTALDDAAFERERSGAESRAKAGRFAE